MSLRRFALATLILTVAPLASAQYAPPSASVLAALDRDFARALAILAGDDEARAARERVTLDPGCYALEGEGRPAERARRRRAVASAWQGQPVAWQVDGIHARGTIGPLRPAMPQACMRLERGQWRFAGYIPGE